MAHHRPDFEEAMELAPLHSTSSAHRFMSRCPSWKPGGELPMHSLAPARSSGENIRLNAYGGCVYAQAPIAAARLVEEEDRGQDSKRFIHSIQGVFTYRAFIDRPFIFEASRVLSSSSFATWQINACQPAQPSSRPNGPFPLSDAQLPSSDTCFTCITTFKRGVESPSEEQGESPQRRYAQILGSRPPEQWPFAPQLDIDYIKDNFPDPGPGAFPILDMRKVEMADFNNPLPPSSRREIFLYRPHATIPKADVNAHIACHAFAGDRNGIIMLGNHLGYGHRLGKAASISYSFYVHVNGDEAVMGDGWWLMEVCWPRTSAGRGIMEVRAWSPEGKHVASGYQDAIVMPQKGPPKL